MDDGLDNSRVALKIVLVLSLLLVLMDFMEIYFSFLHLKEASLKFEFYVFENCIKFHILSQIVFTAFATFAGMSALIMSLGLLINYQYFSTKLIDTFMYWNYLIFGPYLLTACIIGYVNFGMVAFNCDPKDINQKYINFSTLLALVICFLLSIIITMLYSFLFAARKMLLSITFREGGWKLIGRLFWKYVFTRTNRPNLDRDNLNSLQDEHILNERLLNPNYNEINYQRRNQRINDILSEMNDNRLNNFQNNRRRRNIYPENE